MKANSEETAYAHSPAFSAFAYNLLEDILANAANPAQMNRQLVEQLRELTGAQLVVLARQREMEGSQSGHELAAFEPQQRRPLAELPAMMVLAAMTCDLAGPTLWKIGEAPPEAEALLEEGLPGPAAAVPLRVGRKHVGALLLFGLPRTHSLDQVINALGTLSRVVALVLRNAALFEDQEAAIAARTRELAESEEHLEVTLRSIGDAVIATDVQGRVTFGNLVAEELTGWEEAEAQGRPLEEVFPVINEETRRPVENPVARVLREGVVIGLANHTLLVARDGSERPIADSGAPIRNAQGEIIGVVLVFRDQTEERAAQKALRESEERFRSLAQTATDAIITISAEGRIRFFNRAAEQIFGYAPTEVLDRDVTLLMPDEFKARHKAGLSRYHETGQPVVLGKTIELTGRRKDGSLFPLELSLSEVRAGEEKTFISIIRDITGRKRAEEALLMKDYAVASSINSIGITDLKGTLIYVNDAAVKMWGYKNRDEILGRSLPEFWEGDGIYQTIEALEKKGFRFGEDIGKRKDGSVFPVQFSASVVKDNDGNPKYMFGSFIDITERKRAEATLRQLNQAIEQSPVSVVITDTEGAIQYVNPKFSQVTGYSAAEVIGQNPRILQSGEQTPEFYRKLWDTIIAGGEWRGEFHNRKKNGDMYWELASIAGVKDQSGAITHYVAVKEDITQRKRREEEHVRQERLAAVGQLAAGIAHDFNNVMAVITLYSELLQRSPNLTEKEQQKVETIHQQAMHAADLTQQILDFSRRSVRTPRPLDLKPLLNEMLQFIERTIPENIQVRFAFLPGNYTVNADPTQLQQAVTNLTINARDALPRGGTLYFNLSRWTVRAGETPPDPDMEPGEWVKLAVTDTGAGIPPDVLPHIFEPFFTTKEVGKGTGLGLAQVYGIVKQHAGCITVESRLGEGTTFAIYLPALVEETAVK